ncbi:uncharacterized protein LOC119731882 [Patiria miniata]|uniref:Ig-like domain-containing protein n=1 Tax=Patiria miniata TaxID=46514 RepID=A0A914ACA0_PATMI|nr:uncharacterized protein LOC119731882 [Patiria miniata]
MACIQCCASLSTTSNSRWVSNTSIQDIFGGPRYLQKTVWHKIRCPAFRPGESLDGVIWYQGSSVDDPSKARLISRDLRGGINKDTPAEERYSMPSSHSLVIKGVEDRDEGRFLCQVIPQTTEARDAGVDVQVIDDTFPGGSSQVSSSASLQRGRRHTLPCECASQTPDVVYWSTGEGVTTYTQIIGARFSDGTTLHIQHGADYSIGSDASLTVNSLNDVQDTQRFWCHVFKSDGTLRNCNTNVKITDRQQPNKALKASSTSFYVLEGEEQTLPCWNWTPGGTTCEVQWFKIDSSARHVLLSSNLVEADSESELASDFGLIIKSAGGEDSGRYQCDTGEGSGGGYIRVRVIGRKFPLDGGDVSSSSKIYFKAGTNYTLPCQAASDSAEIGSPATVFWSFAKLGNATTTVIGRLHIPGGSKKMSDPRDNNCFSISPEGALFLNGCLEEEDVRYWCHVFPENELLIKSYVDLVVKSEYVHRTCLDSMRLLLPRNVFETC